MNISEIPYFGYKCHHQWLLPMRYGNANYFAWAIVAVVTPGEGGEIIDWGVYMGGCDLIRHERDAVEWIAQHGNKMGREDGGYFFPELPIELYRG